MFADDLPASLACQYNPAAALAIPPLDEDEIGTMVHAMSQLGLPWSLEAPSGGASAMRPVLVAFRSRSALWEQTPTSTRRFSTVGDILDRVRLLGLLTQPDRLLRDDGAALWASAAELARRSPWAVRMAQDLANLHTAWVHAGVDVDRVHQALEDRDGRHGELADLVASLVRLKARLAAHGAIDASTALALGLDAAEAGRVPPSLARFSLIELRHWVDPSELELRTMLALARAGLPIKFVLPLDAEDRGLTAAVEWVVREIEAAHQAPALSLTTEALGSQSAPRAFCAAWYRPSVQSAALMADVPVRIELVRDQASEAQRIASVVAGWAGSASVLPRIAVATRTLDEQTLRIEDALKAFGLPVMRREGRLLLDTASGQVLSELLRLRRDGVPRARLLTLLSQPAFRFARPVEEVGRFAGVLRRAAARTDVEDSTRPRGGYRHRLQRYAASQAASRPIEAALAEEALSAIEDVLNLTDALPSLADLETYLLATRRLIDAAIAPEEDEIAFARLRELVGDALRSLGRASGGLLEDGPAPEVELAAFRKLLLRLLNTTRLPPIAHPAHHAVEIAALPQLLGRSFDYIVIADCVHGKIPATERTDPLLTETDRILINEAVGQRVLKWAEVDLLTPSPLSPRQALEPLWFAAAAAAAERSLFICAASRDMRGRELAPSEFLQEALVAMGANAGDTHAGPEPPALTHPRLQRLQLAQEALETAPGEDIAVSEDSSNDAPHEATLHEAAFHGDAPHDERSALGRTSLSLADRARIHRLDQMARQRRAYFSRDKASPKEAAIAPFAYAVEPARMREQYGFLLGLREDRPLTPTRLESLATCRFRGFIESMLRVDTGLEAGQDADARALGSLAHKALERFFQERAARDVSPRQMGDADRVRLREIVAEEAVPMRAGRETGHLAALDANVAWLETSLCRTVTLLAEQPPVQGARPHRFELNIGVGGQGRSAVAPAVALDLGQERLFLGGEIDRVDKSAHAWVVVDYKNSTGASVRAKVREKELFTKHFQLPLYLRLLTDRMRLHPRIELAAYLISLRDGVPSPVLGENVGMRRRVLDDQAEDGLAAGIGRVILPLLDGAICADEGAHCRGCRVARVCRRPQAGAGLVLSAKGAS